MPWHYVLTDAAVCGTLTCRIGYTLAKTIVERRGDKIQPVWHSIHSSPGDDPATVAGPTEAIVPLTDDRREAARKLLITKPKS